MCECGCGTFNGRWKLKAPNKKWYVISIYGGCQNCDAPAGISIDLMSASECRERLAGSEDFVEIGNHSPNFGIPVLDINKMMPRLLAALKESGMKFDDDIHAEVFMEDLNLWRVVRGSVAETERDFESVPNRV